LAPAYAPYRETNGGEKDNGLYMSVNYPVAYRKWSLEELRLADYQAGRKTATSAPQPAASGFGSTFSSPAQGTTLGGFGMNTTPAQNTFGQPAAQPTNAFGTQSNTGVFGQPAQQQQNTGFGSTFGAAAAPQNPFGGTNNTTTTPSTGFGGFGAAAQPAQTTAQPSMSFGSPFGQTQAAPATSSIFGAPAQTPAAPANPGRSFWFYC